MSESCRQRNGRSRGVPLFRTLSASLFLWLSGIFLVAFAAYAFISLRTTSDQWEQTVYAGADRLSEVIKKATHQGMLLNHKEDVHNTIQAVAATDGVLGVRIYDKEGVIIFSADGDEIGHRVDRVSEACIACHDQSEPLESVPQEGRMRVYPEGGERVLALINPIENAPECSSAACHAHSPDQTILGVLDVKMSLALADSNMAAARQQAVLAAVLLALIIALTSAVFIDRLVRRPVTRLIEGTESIARGHLDEEIAPGAHNEIGQLADAFNRMTRDLSEARRQNEEWAQTLERKVVDKTDELRRTQRQVVHMEKMASLGKLAATVVHELNNPLSGILSYSKLVDRTLAEEPASKQRNEEVARYLRLIQKESSRCGDIIRNLLIFARRTGAEPDRNSLNGVVDRALTIVRHHLDIAGISVETHPLEGDDRILCDADQISQALVALFVNAAEAMAGGGTLTVGSVARHDAVEVAVADTGPGIPAEVLPSIFEPFFSTKDGTSGVGLGLAVVYGIVQRHQGRIEVESEVGRGTTFRVTLPREPAFADEDDVDLERERRSVFTAVGGEVAAGRAEERKAT